MRPKRHGSSVGLGKHNEIRNCRAEAVEAERESNRATRYTKALANLGTDQVHDRDYDHDDCHRGPRRSIFAKWEIVIVEQVADSASAGKSHNVAILTLMSH